ncbi:hypothetical protein HYZ64_00995, partial [Candidatus Berkelbacteria bacterium]|nr:hypothetical protein [Candidatus Berkelbacteria bacterium]
MTTYTKAVISQKLEDRFLTTQVIEPDEADSELGTLFALVEITRPWYPNAQIGQTIINTLKREYYRGKSTSDLENFEQALKKVNETLARITETGETDWIGHLSSVIALRVDKQIHLSSAGNARGYLLRRGKLAEVTEPSVRAEEPHPLATFSSIVSGEITMNDIVLLTSPALIEEFDKNTLKDLLADESSYQAATNIVKRLPKDRRRSVNFLVLGESPKSDERYPSVVYLDEAAGAATTAFRDIVTKQVVPALEVAVTYLREKILPESKRLGKLAYDQTRKQAIPFVRQTIAKTATKFKEVTKEKEPVHQSIIGKNLFTVHDYHGAKSAAAKGESILKGLRLPTPKLPVLRLPPQTKARLSSIGHSVLVRVKNFLKEARAGKRRTQLLVVGALALALVLIVSISAQRSNSSSKARFTDQKERLTQAKRQAEEGKTALIFGQQAQAQKLFAQALEGARFAAPHPKLNEEAQSVLNEVEGQLDKLTGTTRFKDMKPLMEVGSTTGMAEFDSKVWGFNDSGNLVAANLLEGTTDQVAAAEKAVKVTVTAKQDDKLFGLTSEGQLLRAHLKDKTVKVVPALEGATLKNGKDIKIFSGNLYLLDPQGNQIWRYPLSDEGYKPAAGFFKKGPGLGNAIAMAIDGAIYVLKQDGTVDKYLKGEKQGFTLAAAPEPDKAIQDPKKIVADADSLSI